MFTKVFRIICSSIIKYFSTCFALNVDVVPRLNYYFILIIHARCIIKNSITLCKYHPCDGGKKVAMMSSGAFKYLIAKIMTRRFSELLPSTLARYIRASSPYPPLPWNSYKGRDYARDRVGTFLLGTIGGRNRTPSPLSPSSSSCPSTYRGLTSRRDTPSTLYHMGLTVLVMDNRAPPLQPLSSAPTPCLARARRERAIFHGLFTFWRRTSTVKASRRSGAASRRQRGGGNF